MKNATAAVLNILIFCFAQCEKTPLPNNTSEIPGLPPATQTGANTLGFLLNGVPWVPEGSYGVPNLSIDFDPGINQGIVGINGYRAVNQYDKSSFGIGVIDSLNVLIVPFVRHLSRKGIFRVGYSNRNNCTLFSHYDSVWSEGMLFLDKLDRNRRIIAGRFELTLYEPGCDTFKITHGRFDMKF